MKERPHSCRLNFMRAPETETFKQPRGLLRRAFRALRLPVRLESPVDRDAAQVRAVRMFSANFKTPWNP